MKFITLTLNPAFDMHCVTPSLTLGTEQFAEISEYNAGGKGINLTRALLIEKVPVRALSLVGEENKDVFLSMLKKDGVHLEAVAVPGRIRENITIHHDNGVETRVSFRGFQASEEDLGELAFLALDDDLNDTVVTLTGSNPPGINNGMVIAFLLALKQAGAKLVIDSKSFSLEELSRLHPALIKPNMDELMQLVGHTVKTEEEIMNRLTEIRKYGIERVLISMGEKGAILSSAKGISIVKAPEIKAVSTIGAGDSMIAGYLTGCYMGEDDKNALERAVAYGSASCLTPGTKPPTKESINRLLERIRT